MTQTKRKMKFDPTIFIGYLIGMLLISQIFLLDFETFIINAGVILIGILFTFILSRF